MPLPPLRGQPAVTMPTLLAPQQGMTCPAGWRDAGFEPGTAGFTVWCTSIEPPHPQIEPPHPLHYIGDYLKSLLLQPQIE